MKPIKLTEKLIEEMKSEIMKKIEEKFNPEKLKADVASSLSKIKMSDGSFKFVEELKYEKKFTYEKSDRRVTIKILPEAYAKMLTIIMSQDKEVGWHGVTERVSARKFILKDILVYPQMVTAVTVDTDEEEYAKWMITLPDEVFNNMHFHGHSHVNMGVTPSTTDDGHRAKITEQLTDEDYYIFMIWNKSLKWSGAVYDMQSNTLYDTEDIDVVISLGDITAGDLIKDLDSKVVSTYMKWQSQNKKNETNQKIPAASGNAESQTKGVNGVGNDPDDFHGPYRYGNGYGGSRGNYGQYSGYGYGYERYTDY